jgi:hypothetical protein
MRLHRVLPLVALLCSCVLWTSGAFAQTEDRPKQVEAGPRAKKMHVTEAPHSPLFIEQKEVPGLSKTAMHSDAVRLFDKAKD